MAKTAFNLLLNGVNLGTVHNAKEFEQTTQWIDTYLLEHPEIKREDARISFEFINEEPCSHC